MTYDVYSIHYSRFSQQYPFFGMTFCLSNIESKFICCCFCLYLVHYIVMFLCLTVNANILFTCIQWALTTICWVFYPMVFLDVVNKKKPLPASPYLLLSILKETNSIFCVAKKYRCGNEYLTVCTLHVIFPHVYTKDDFRICNL